MKDLFCWEARKDGDELFPISFSFQNAEAGVIGNNNEKNFEIRHKLEGENKRSVNFGELLYKVTWTYKSPIRKIRALCFNYWRSGRKK